MNGDRGAATVLSAALSMALLALLWFVLQLGAVTIARHHAEGAADLAALAAAAYAPHGQQLACERANQVATGMRVEIAECRMDGWDARVEVRAGLPAFVLGGQRVGARARAGPTEE
ncbi:Rv3654c family TadE-like protein [Saccharopolyspora phatthalungensis]|uniref:Secretion/DNA translocation related TadE-like protein n=1 Tax=Saccharopolyspora phatthalungensis TaxID=664693 RepID=A0A840Q0C5_9PSEU|nr:Rv3654c family TadE-like protein [Saccharopolyspora phatthalungensis]MBB5153986.1 secretion/DNA translocation related TadE-like protein [Saccharopolyspora phatthalungensis]